MAETVPPDPAWVADLLTRELRVRAAVVHLEQRPDAALYRADAVGQRLFVKVGPPAAIAQEAANLRHAFTLVDHLAPAVAVLVEQADGLGLLAMEWVPGTQLEPGRLSRLPWRLLGTGLRRLHSQGPARAPTCSPLEDDFITLSLAEAFYATMPDFKLLLNTEAHRVPGLDARGALALFDTLLNDVETKPDLFTRPARYVHADIWPQNVLIERGRCWLVDWAWLKSSDYALDLANLKLMLDWVWPPWRAQYTFEQVLASYETVFCDATLVARMRVFLPLVSLIHLVQFGRGDAEHPGNAAAMRMCLATALRDRVLWSLPVRRRRLLYALTHCLPSEYGAAAPTPAGRVGRRGSAWLAAHAGRRVAGRSDEHSGDHTPRAAAGG